MTKKQLPQTLKGFRDFLPKEAEKRQWLKNRLMEIFELWGYSPLETPTLEKLELFKGQIGEDEMLFYQFEDRGGREVALRYDQTVPLCRVAAEYKGKLPTPFKRYQIQPVFRAEKPQKGRYREFLQCDADILGVSSPIADAEIIGLSLDIYKRLGFKKAKVLINDRKLLKNIPYQAISSIDKLKKIGSDGVINDMVEKGISQKEAKKYLETIKSLKPNDTIKTILNYLKQLGFDKTWYQFDPTIARSFSYSDGPIWEVIIPNSSGGSVLGGERFDGLTKKISGINIPGTGFGLGFDRTLEAAEELGLTPKTTTTTKILITILDKTLLSKNLKATQQLRQSGINTEVFSNLDVKLLTQLKYADQKNIPYALIIGEDEAKKNLVTLKNLKTRQQKTLPIEDVIQKLK